MLRARDLPYPALVLRVDERKEQADRDAFGSRRNEPVERGPRRIFVERLDGLAARPNPLPHPEAHRARGEEHRRLGVEPDLVHLAPHLAANLEGVAETLGGDDPEPAALSLQHRVGRHRGAVRELGNRGGRNPLPGKAFDGGEGRLAGVRRRARDLEHEGRAPVAHADHVGECAAYVHPDAAACWFAIHQTIPVPERPLRSDGRPVDDDLADSVREGSDTAARTRRRAKCPESSGAVGGFSPTGRHGPADPEFPATPSRSVSGTIKRRWPGPPLRPRRRRAASRARWACCRGRSRRPG